jgi:hypothetical protein
MIMAADATKEIQFEIGDVLFIDIVGYSKLSVNEQHRAVEELTKIGRADLHRALRTRFQNGRPQVPVKCQ